MDSPESNLSTRHQGQSACGGLSLVGRSLAALRLSGRSRPGPPPRASKAGMGLLL